MPAAFNLAGATPALLHAREMVLPADISQGLQGMIADGGAGDAHWHLHRDAERYLEKLLPYAREIEGPPLPGDVAVFRFGRTFSHGVIVIEWPRLIHAYWQRGVVWGDATLNPLLGHKVRFFGVIDARGN